MVELLSGVTVSTLAMLLFAFGFAPGAALRLLLRLYPAGHPRRRELLAEVYAVDRLERPFWVAEQLEVAISEGLTERLRAMRDSPRSQRTPHRIRHALLRYVVPVSTTGANFAVLALTDEPILNVVSTALWLVICTGWIIWDAETDQTRTEASQNVVVRPVTAQASISAETPSVVTRLPSES